MNILYLDHYAGSIKHGRSFRPYYLGKEWLKEGHRLTVVGGSYSHVRTMQPKQLGIEDIEGITYLWLKTPHYVGNGLKRFWSMIVFILQLFFHTKQILRLSKPDVIIASTVYMLDIFPAWVMAKCSGARLVFELHDIWPASPIELGPMNKWHPFILLLAATERFVYRVSDKVVSILPKTYDHMKRFGVKPEQFLHVPNGIDLDDWQHSEPLPPETEAYLASLKEQGKFLICYAGSHATSNALTTLLDAATLLSSTKLHVILIGDGQEKASLQAYANQHGIKNVSFMGRIPKRSIPTALARMDGLYIGWQKQPLYRFGISANKLFDYMMAAKPIIHSVTAGNDPIAEAQCGISVEAEDTQAVTQAIESLMVSSPEALDSMGKKGKAYVLTHHDYRVLAKDFLKALR